ncbi:hypothetical protein LOD99_567 [Oopsacas minuta]|uniref:Uncharacterized protein n=1 Tax=Oopsacas minuta TaxID=111878 RepID=A0AAV7KAH6_9METZ|nr:hypothetical protein LOD99_567 [Oopsacas minuta]
MKNFVKAIVKYNKEEEDFKYLKDKFPMVNDAKIKEGVFIGPQIREQFKDLNFEACLNSVEKAPWNSFKSLTENFLGTKKSPIYEELVVTLLDAFRTMGCNMSLKMQFLHSHFAIFSRKSRCYTEIVKRTSEHTHVPDEQAMSCCETKLGIKRKAQESQDGAHHIVGESLQTASEGTAAKLPKLDSLKRTIQRQRASVLAAPAQPTTLAELALPAVYQ